MSRYSVGYSVYLILSTFLLCVGMWLDKFCLEIMGALLFVGILIVDFALDGINELVKHLISCGLIKRWHSDAD